MSPSIEDRSIQNEFDRSAVVLDAEQTLRLIASLPASEGIEDRVKRSLHSAPRQARIIAWPFPSADGGSWMRSGGMRAAAAAAIVLVIAGGGWEVYSHIRPAALPTAFSVPQVANGSGAFNSAGAKRVPQTLEGPVVASPVVAQKKQETEGTAGAAQKHNKRSLAKKSVGSVTVER
jgi:hypothetical protein